MSDKKVYGHWLYLHGGAFFILDDENLREQSPLLLAALLPNIAMPSGVWEEVEEFLRVCYQYTKTVQDAIRFFCPPDLSPGHKASFAIEPVFHTSRLPRFIVLKAIDGFRAFYSGYEYEERDPRCLVTEGNPRAYSIVGFADNTQEAQMLISNQYVPDFACVRFVSYKDGTYEFRDRNHTVRKAEQP